MDKNLKITLFVPVLNELEGMQEFLMQAPLHLFCQILIVDGGSTDGSVEWAKKQGFEVISQKKKGLRIAYTEGWPHIKGEYVLTYSPDGNCVGNDMNLLFNKLHENSYDLIIASRYLAGKKSADDDLITSFGNWMFTKLINLFFNGRYTDVMNIFRLYKTNLFYELDLHLDSSHWEEKLFFTVVGLEPLMSIRSAKRNLKISEVPTFEPPRKYGVRKLQIFRWGSAHLVQVFYEFLFWR